MTFRHRLTDEQRARFDKAVNAASDAFFAELVKQYPEATTGDFTGPFDSHAADAAEEWVMLNVPDLDCENG